jgi:hypothetical protein
LNQINYKTLIPALAGAFVLVYEASTGLKLDTNAVNYYTNEALTLAGIIGTVWGIYKNHKK